MTVSQKNSNNPERHPPVSEKKCPISVGTAAFLIFSFLLIAGFCKFSFYVLKNHRNAIDRETLVKTYVDVQPYSGVRKEKSSYIVLKNQNKAAPAPFFVSGTSTASLQKTSIEITDRENAPLPVLNGDKQKTPETRPVAATVKRPPVIRTAVVPHVSESKEKEIKIENKETEIIALDKLMTSGMSLLTESDEAVMASELLLQETSLPDDVKPAEKKSDITKESKARPSSKTENKKQTEKKLAAKKKSSPETRWVDIAQLRLELSKAKENEEIKRKNAALLEMNDARQTAALKTETTTDVMTETSEPVPTEAKNHPPADSQSAIQNQKVATPETSSTQQTAVVQDAPFAGTAEAPQQPTVRTAVVQDAPFAGTAESSQQPTVQTAVVQDVPFAGTTEAPEQSAATNQKAFLAGDSPSLWKVAKVRGKPKNALAVKEPEPTSQATEKPIETAALSAIEQTREKPTVIYKNGKVSAVIQNQSQKSLNWLDRQEAAVWTSMSQSDTPSVWSTAADAENVSADRAKAFRVANEQPEQSGDKKNTTEAADNVISSLPVRVVGEEQKPEVKNNPVLLPLGTPTPVSATGRTVPTAVVSPNNSVVLPPKVNPEGLPNALSPTADVKTEKASENGLVDKLFSFFGKSETNSMPDVGTGTAPIQQTETENPKKQRFKTADKQTAPSTAFQSKQPEKDIVPTELRLTFKPNSSEISAQSIKWIKAFGQKAKKDIQNAVEVRMSNIDPDLQEKRFALIHSTLTGVGMEDVQVIPVMTDRTPHTIVLRMIVLPEEGYTEYTSENGGIKERLYYKKW